MIKVLAIILAAKGVSVVMYLGDWFVTALSQGQALSAIDFVLAEMARLDFLINCHKSQLSQLTQTLDWMALSWHSAKASYQLTTKTVSC